MRTGAAVRPGEARERPEEAEALRARLARAERDLAALRRDSLATLAARLDAVPDWTPGGGARDRIPPAAQAEIDRLRDLLDAREAELAAALARVGQLAAAADALGAELAALRASASWRVTAPLRLALDALRRR